MTRSLSTPGAAVSAEDLDDLFDTLLRVDPVGWEFNVGVVLATVLTDARITTLDEARRVTACVLGGHIERALTRRHC